VQDGAPDSRGRFITLEGPEGSGKTTAARHLVSWLESRGLEAVLTREPGGTPVGEEIRHVLLHYQGVADDLDPRTDALLFAAQRAQHVSRLIRPSLERGAWVVSARYLDSSLAYQGVGYGIDRDEMARLQRFATYELLPDLTILLDVPVDVGLQRKRHGEWNRFEDTEALTFFDAVRGAYLEMARAEPERFVVIDGSGSVQEVDLAIRGVVADRLLSSGAEATGAIG
jgi:dTMP kinase